MPNSGFPFKFLTFVRDEGGRSTSRTSARRQINLESLEGRALLTAVGHSHTVAAQVTGLPQRPHPGPVLNNVGLGFAVKSPRFYEAYSGNLRPELNAAGMKATYDAQGNLVLTGMVVGTVNPAPQDSSGSQFYVFGINHNTATTIAPFPGRPRIKYDAIVAVGVTPGGISAYVLDSATGAVTQLGAGSVLIQSTSPLGDLSSDIKVFVPAGTPGIQQNSDGSNPSAIFWAQDSEPSFNPNPSDVASFAPDGRDVVIAGAPGQQPNPHLL